MSGQQATARRTAPRASAAQSAYVVTAPCVVVRGDRGSSGVFYQQQAVLAWTAGDGNPDSATADELRRLLELGMIEAQ